MSACLQLKRGAVDGILGGKVLHCLTFTPGGTALPAGLYDVQSPVQDPTYGSLAIMVPKSASPKPKTFVSTAISKAAGTGSSKQKIVLTPGTNSWLLSMIQSLPSATKVLITGATAPVFVLVSQPIPGCNSIIVQNQFADLIYGLTRERGASVQVS